MNNKINNQIAPLFSNPSLQKDGSLNQTNISNQPIKHKKLLELYLKGIKLYNQNLSSFNTNNLNSNKLILGIKKNTLNNLTLNNSSNNDINKDNLDNSITSLNLNQSSVSIRINKYLKAINLLNYNNKGKLANYSDNVTYNFNNVNNKLIKNIYTLLEYSFISMSCLISKPVFEMTPEKVVIHLYFFVFNKDNSKDQNSFLIKNSNKLNKISNILSSYFKKPVELELVRLHYPYLNNNILVNLLGLIVNKIKIRFIMKKLFKKAIIKNPTKLNRKNNLTIIPSFLSGIKIRIAGRLLTHRVVPRKTIKVIRRGALARGKVNFFDVARFTNKNKRGAYSITISSGQNIS